MNDVVVSVQTAGPEHFHATACAHVFAKDPEMAAILAGSRALGCHPDQIELKPAGKSAIYVATRRQEPAAPAGRAS